EDVSFIVELVTRLSDCALEDLEIVATFPNEENPTKMVGINCRTWAYWCERLTSIGDNVFGVKFYKMNKTALEVLEKLEARVRAEIESLKELLEKVERPKLRECIRRLIESCERMLKKIEEQKEKCRVLIAEGGLTIKVNADAMPPKIVSISPSSGATCPITMPIRVVFDEPVKRATVDANTFRVGVIEAGQEFPVIWEGDYVFEDNDRVVEYRPKEGYPDGATVCVEVGAGLEATIEDIYGNGMVESEVIYFQVLAGAWYVDIENMRSEVRMPGEERETREYLKSRKGERYDVKVYGNCKIMYRIYGKANGDNVKVTLYVRYPAPAADATEEERARDWFYSKVSVSYTHL
ncbi:MAG: Ig-like domain-containing protein, partial [Planctomycetota bacterium]|nr:Ig-like domain-containing protein [Planctomycetota bacterium]